MANTNEYKAYSVVTFLQLPYDRIIDKYVCVPTSWIKSKDKAIGRVFVAFPVEDIEVTRKRVEKAEPFGVEWQSYLAIVKYATDDYGDADIWIIAYTPLYGEYSDMKNNDSHDTENCRIGQNEENSVNITQNQSYHSFGISIQTPVDETPASSISQKSTSLVQISASSSKTHHQSSKSLHQQNVSPATEKVASDHSKKQETKFGVSPAEDNESMPNKQDSEDLKLIEQIMLNLMDLQSQLIIENPSLTVNDNRIRGQEITDRSTKFNHTNHESHFYDGIRFPSSSMTQSNIRNSTNDGKNFTSERYLEYAQMYGGKHALENNSAAENLKYSSRCNNSKHNNKTVFSPYGMKNISSNTMKQSTVSKLHRQIIKRSFDKKYESAFKTYRQQKSYKSNIKPSAKKRQTSSSVFDSIEGKPNNTAVPANFSPKLENSALHLPSIENNHLATLQKYTQMVLYIVNFDSKISNSVHNDNKLIHPPDIEMKNSHRVRVKKLEIPASRSRQFNKDNYLFPDYLQENHRDKYRNMAANNNHQLQYSYFTPKNKTSREQKSSRSKESSCYSCNKMDENAFSSMISDNNCIQRAAAVKEHQNVTDKLVKTPISNLSQNNGHFLDQPISKENTPSLSKDSNEQSNKIKHLTNNKANYLFIENAINNENKDYLNNCFSTFLDTKSMLNDLRKYHDIFRLGMDRLNLYCETKINETTRCLAKNVTGTYDK